MKRFMFFYFLGDDSNKIQKTIPAHAEYWQGLSLPGYDGGAFVDKSGGCIVFNAESLDEAKKITMQDPFVLENCLSEYYVNEWVAGN